MEEFKDYVDKYLSRLSALQSFFEEEKLFVEFDRLEQENSVSQELLSLSTESNENYQVFIFGFDFFEKDLEEQEFKRDIGFEHLNFRILRAYKDLKESQDNVKVSDLLHQLQDEKKDSAKVNMYLEKILTLAYYQNWHLEKDNEDIEGDYYIEIPDQFLLKPRQRFNYDISASIYEDPDIFIFLNSRGKINIVFKQLDEFGEEEIKSIIFPALKHIFNVELTKEN